MLPPCRARRCSSIGGNLVVEMALGPAGLSRCRVCGGFAAPLIPAFSPLGGEGEHGVRVRAIRLLAYYRPLCSTVERFFHGLEGMARGTGRFRELIQRVRWDFWGDLLSFCPAAAAGCSPPRQSPGLGAVPS